MDKLMMVEKELKESFLKKYDVFAGGDIIKVYYKIREKDKERIRFRNHCHPRHVP